MFFGPEDGVGASASGGSSGGVGFAASVGAAAGGDFAVVDWQGCGLGS